MGEVEGSIGAGRRIGSCVVWELASVAKARLDVVFVAHRAGREDHRVRMPLLTHAVANTIYKEQSR